MFFCARYDILRKTTQLHIFIVRDFIQTGCGIHMTDQRATHVSKALAILFGIIGYAFIFVVKNVGGVLEVL